MSIITDGLLIATCLTAALYCIVLSRRLARFSDTKSGIGEQISQLNSILEETRTTIRESQGGAKSVSDRLSRDLAGSKKASQDLSALIEQAETALDRALELQDRGVRPEPSAVVQPKRPEPAPRQEPVLEQPAPRVAPETPEEEFAPIEEQAHDDIAERDFDLADARGEPQLGFLPNVSDTSSMADAGTDEADSEKMTSETLDVEDSENLLKVERMAL